MSYKINIVTTVDEQLIRQTPGSVGYDLRAAEEVTIIGGCHKLIPTGVRLGSRLPETLFMGLLPRSSLFKRHGLILTNSLGVIDQDYTEEIMVSLFKAQDSGIENMTTIKEGERIAQAIFFEIAKPDLIFRQEQRGMNTRGGFGSTGV